MRIFFEHNLIGSPANFVWDDGNIVINDAAPYDWRFESTGKRKGSIRAAAEAAGCNLLLDPNVPQTQFWKRHIQHPAWSSVLSRAQFSTHLRMQVENVLNFITDPVNTYFLTHFQIQQSLIDSLQPGRVRDARRAVVEAGRVRARLRAPLERALCRRGQQQQQQQHSE